MSGLFMASADDQHEPAANVPALAHAMGFRDRVERKSSLDGKPKAPGFDESTYFSERMKSVAVKKAAAEAHAVLFRAVAIGECKHV